jgi:hypothetical protein
MSDSPSTSDQRRNNLVLAQHSPVISPLVPLDDNNLLLQEPLLQQLQQVVERQLGQIGATRDAGQPELLDFLDDDFFGELRIQE